MRDREFTMMVIMNVGLAIVILLHTYAQTNSISIKLDRCLSETVVRR